MMSPKIRTALVLLTAMLVWYGVDRTGVINAARARAVEPAAPAALTVHSSLPSPAEAKRILNTTMRHREWAEVPVGQRSILAWMVYPERSDKAPVVVLTGQDGQPSDWLRAIGDQFAAEGFIAMAPTVTSTREAAAVRQ